LQVTITGRWVRNDGAVVPPAVWARGAHAATVVRSDACLRLRSRDRNRSYTAVEFRSSAPLTIDRIHWESFDLIGAL
jgi:hypothetical protein